MPNRFVQDQRNNLAFLIGGQILGVLAIALVWSVVGIVRGTEHDVRIPLCLGAIIAAGASLLVVLHRRRRARRAAFAEGMAALARELGGDRCESGSPMTIRWLRAHWPKDAVTADADAQLGLVAQQTIGVLRGHSFLVDFEPDGISGEDGVAPRLRIFVAAPGIASGPSAGRADERAGDIIRRADGAGLKVEIRPGTGLVAEASYPVIKRLRKDAAGLVHLSAIVGELVALATDLSGATTKLPVAD